MINVATFTAPRVDSQHLAELVGACVRVVGRLLEVYTVEYNQELQDAMVTIDDDNRDLVVDYHVEETGAKVVELS